MGGVIEMMLVPIIIIGGMAYSIVAKKLTVPAACIGGLLAITIFMAAGLTGVAMMTAFFLLGSLATSWKQELKNKFVDTPENKTGRKVSQVLANAGVSALAGLLILFYPRQTDLLLLAMAAAFASATADTLSSELGMVYGTRFFNIKTFRADECGRDGVISLEGSVIGFIGSCLIALVHAIGYGFHLSFFWIVLAGTFGNLLDSILGAVFERKGLIGNNAVNFLSTLSAGLIALLLGAVI
ncbi:DUF92 domain-containing protein [Pedobacter agri]|uniref:DUF92 domain-containing protein n=1 Tax=Pedobacter agri TaxID=454586 RepID=UPI00292D22E8|nr:DUF92 domain-containing protein [Pedobacter agri]